MKRKRAMVMIFVVIMVASITTIIAASVDFGRMASYKQHQLEREAKWQYCVDSAKALVTQDLAASSAYTQSISKTLNGVNLSISSAQDSTWNDPNGEKIVTSGTLEGKAKSSTTYMGKRATVQPPQFALFFTNRATPDAAVTSNADIYYNGTFDASKFRVSGDVYSSATTSPTFMLLTGSFIGRQPGLKISLDDNSYYNNASVKTSGTSTLSSPLNLLSLTHSQLRYHTGNLTITGTVTGEITVFVKGNVTIKSVSWLTTLISRLVVICDGNVSIDGGTSYAFIICNGDVTSTDSGSSRTIYGSIAGANFVDTQSTYRVVYDNYFNTNQSGGYRYWLPGQW